MKRITSILIVFFLLGCTSPGPKIYIANEGDGTITVIDSSTLEVVDTIKLAGMPHNVNVDPKGRFFYATNHEGEEDEPGEMHHVPFLRVLDVKTNKLIGSVPMKEIAAHVVPSRQRDVVYVSREGGNTVLEIDIIKGLILRAFKTGDGPHGFVLSNDDKTLYVPNMKSNDVSIVNIATGKEERINIMLDGMSCETPVAMGISEDDRFSFVTCGKSFDIYQINNKERKVIARVALEKGEFPGPIQIPVHPHNKYLYVPDMRHDVVHKISIEPFALLKDIPSGKGAHGIAFSADGKIAYVTNTWENTVSVIDLDKEEIVKTISVGSKPNGIALQGGKNQGW